VQIDYDPSVISFEQIVDIFWKEHDPTSSSWSRQYKNILFYLGDEQRRIAERSRDLIAERTGRKVKTEVLPYAGFTRAEDYHQKHTLKRFRGLTDEMKAIYPSEKDLTDSTAAARLNGYLGGYGSCNTLKGEIDLLGLSEEGRSDLASIVCGKKGAITCTTSKR